MSAMTIAEYRELAGVTQAEMAMQMELPFRTYQDIEAGKVTFRPLHATAAQMAMIRIAVAKEDASFLPAGIAGLVREAAKLLAYTGPSFAAKALKDGSSWYVLVTWPSGAEEHVLGFGSKFEADAWIRNDSSAWLSIHPMARHSKGSK